MSNVDFNDILYLSPLVAVYPEYVIIKTNDFSDLDRILDMCGKERDDSIPIKKSESTILISLKEKG